MSEGPWSPVFSSGDAAEVATHALYAEDQFQIMANASHITHKSPPPFAAHYVEVEVDEAALYLELHRRPGQYRFFADANNSGSWDGRLGGDVRIDVEQVDDIPAERSGKYRYVVSEVPLPDGLKLAIRQPIN